MRRIVSSTAAVLAVLGLAGCGDDAASEDTAEAPTADAAVPEPTPADEAGGEAETTAEQSTDAFGLVYTRASFGEAVRLDGVDVTVGSPAPYEPTDGAVGHEQAAAVQFEITLANNGDDPVEPEQLAITVRSADVWASSIGDDEAGIGLVTPGSSTALLPPDGSLAPGEQEAWTMAWSVTDPVDVTMELGPNSLDLDVPLFVFGT